MTSTATSPSSRSRYRATTCDLTPPVTLAPGESYLCSFDAFTAGDAGDTVTDTVTGSGTDDDRNPVRNAIRPTC